MATGSFRMQYIKGNCLRYALTVLRWIVEPSAIIEEKQRRRVRLLSIFLLFIAINTLIGAMAVKNAGNSSWPTLLATAAILAVGYGLSRTIYFRLATAIAISMPTVPILAMILFSANRAQIPNQLPWLALPLLVSSLLLSLRSTIIIAISYIVIIAVLIPFAEVPAANLSQSVAFMFMIFFFVVAITATRQHDQREIENQLTERQHAEEALRESEEKFSKAFRSSPVSITINTLKDGVFIEVNDSFTRMSGYTREEVIGRSSADISIWAKAEDRARMLQILKKQGRVYTQEFEFRVKSGDIRTWLYSAELINFGGELCLIVLSIDVTERKRVEEKLRESEEKYRAIFEQASDSIVVINSKTGAIVDFNDRAHENLGYSREEFAKLTVTNIDAIGSTEDVKKHIEKTHGRGTNAFETKHKTKDGEIRDVLISATTIDNAGNCFDLCIWHDITELKRAEEALRESEEKFSKAFHSSPDSIAITTLKDGKFIEVNDGHTRFSGYTREDVIGRHSTDFNTWAKAEDRARMLQKLKKQGKVHNEEFDFLTKSGEIRTSLFSAELINIGGEPCIISTTTDITERKRADEALRESEEKFSKAFRSSPEAIVISRLKDNTIIEINESFTHFTGYTREEVINHDSDELNLWVYEEERARMLQIWNEQGRVYREEFHSRMKSGEIRVGLFSGELINIGGEPCLNFVITDITEGKRAEKALRESEEKFFKAFRSSPNTMVITTLEDGKFIEVNDSHTRVTGYTREETIGHSASELGLWVKAEDRARMVQILREQGRVQNEEFEFRMKSGEIRVWLFSAEPININGEPCIISMTIDITELKRAEEALRESEEKFFKAFRSSPDVITLTTLEDGKFLEVNDSFTRFIGYTREEVIGHRSTEFGIRVKANDRNRIVKMLKEKSRVHNEEFDFRMKSGEIRTALYSAEPIDIGGEPCIIAVTVDITERKQAQEKLKQALSNLEQSSAQLAATNKELEAFSYSASHDLRAPLRTIDGFSQALLEDYLDKFDEQGKDYLSRLRSASQKMGELIDGLLKLSRLTRSDMHKEKVDLSALAEEITTKLQEAQPERQVEVVISRGLTASGDRQLLRALLENLLGNAWKFTGKCPQARIEFGATRNGDKKAYFVRDNGAGFDMTYADKLFGAFQRLHETTEFPGTGIGLATVRRIINRHGGSVWAEGAVGKGATFYFTLN